MCANKLYSYFAELNRQARREDVSLDVENLGRLLIISTTVSQDLLDTFGATINPAIDCSGVYSFPKGWFGSIIAINKLPVTKETLWLRILGKGQIQRRAVDELLALPDTSEHKENTLRLIANWRIITIKQTNLIEEDQEIVMNLSTAYVEWEQKTLEQGRQEGEQQGIQQGEKRLIIRQINKRFDVIPDALVEQIHQLSIEQLELLSEAFLDFSTITDLEQWLENRT